MTRGKMPFGKRCFASFLWKLACSQMAGYLGVDWSLCGRYMELLWSYMGRFWGLIGNTVGILWEHNGLGWVVLGVKILLFEMVQPECNGCKCFRH